MKKIVIFGAGETGSAAFEFFGEQRVTAFVDNMKTGKFCGKPILGFDALPSLLPEVLVVVASLKYKDELVQQLQRHGINRYYVFTEHEWDILPAKLENEKMKYCHFDELLSSCKIHEYGSIALYGDNSCVDLLLASLDICGCAGNVKYIVNPDGETLTENPYKIPTIVDYREADPTDVLIAATQKNNFEISEAVKKLGNDTINIYDHGKPRKRIFSSDAAKYRNIHKGQRCFIIGTGPSLRMEDLEKLRLQRELCIGTNKIFMAFPQTNWRPDYYIIIDRRQISQYGKEIFELPVRHKFVADRRLPFWDTEYAEGAIKIHVQDELYHTEMPSFSTDVSDCVYEGCTVTYAAMQLAAHMGFNEIYLLGVDFNYSGDFSKGENHFCKGYIKENETYLVSDEDKVMLAYQKAEIYSQKHGFRIFNATRGGKLEIFERVDLDNLFD